MADRSKRVKSLIAKNIADIVQFEIHDPKIGMVSINETEVNNDYSLARVYVSFLGAKYPHQNFEELKKSEGMVRSRLAKKLDLYKVPKVIFIYDDIFEKADSLDKALKEEEEAIKKAKKGDK
ncbi:MAG: 30S ribosome-binding factor RbfA [Bacilli bacterium]|nr:30S ribosome-binding factor RbfA [Bacilli bacterium]